MTHGPEARHATQVMDTIHQQDLTPSVQRHRMFLRNVLTGQAR
jgi:hypothetical protein